MVAVAYAAIREFGAIGDAVNVTARVQAPRRETGEIILLTEAKRRLLRMRGTGVYDRGEAELRGIADPVALYSAAADLDERSTHWRKSLITDA